MSQENFIKYGGVKFSNNVSPEVINRFVRALPSSKKDSLYEVIKELEQEGLITLHHEFSTIDDEMLPYLRTE